MIAVPDHRRPGGGALAPRPLAFGLATAVVLLCAAGPAAAQTTGNVATFIQNFTNAITGPIGTALAALAIVVVGLGALFGQFSARTLGSVVAGIALVFSASWVVSTITGGATP